MMMIRRSAPLVLALAACTSSSTTALFTASALPGGSPKSDFYELPYPNDLRRNPDNTLDLSLFPTHSMIVDQYRQVAQTLDGFSLNGAIFARFSGPIDPATLPQDAMASIQPDASVYLENIDANSTDLGQLVPIKVTFHPEGTDTIGGNRLVVRPYPGFGLDEGTTYALVITDRVKDTAGRAVAASSDFKAVMGSGGNAAIARARQLYAPLHEAIGQNGLDAKQHAVSAAVFTTEHATFIAPAIRKGVYGTAAPVAANLTLANTVGSDYTLWTGTYTAPNFQSGDVPYLTSGGEISVGSDGAAVVQRMEPMRFALSVPSGPTPATGWPIVIYQHGTGGDWQSFVQDGTADYLALQKVAVISTDQVLHGPRNPAGDEAVDFFNFANPYAGRDNALQGAADAWSQMRLALGLSFTDAAARTITFDPARVMFFGHSQGGLTGPGFIAFEPALKGAVLSGTGGLLYLSMLYKTMPIDFPQLVETLARDSPMDEDNPSLALAQMWIERADGANYAKFFVREPQTAAGPKNIFQSEGFTDTFAPNPAIEAFATAVGGDLVMTRDEQDVPGLTALRGRTVKPTPIAGNFGAATAVLAQYKMASGSDGHFVVFDIGSARMQSVDFLSTLASTGRATVVVAP